MEKISLELLHKLLQQKSFRNQICQKILNKYPELCPAEKENFKSEENTNSKNIQTSLNQLSECICSFVETFGKRIPRVCIESLHSGEDCINSIILASTMYDLRRIIQSLQGKASRNDVSSTVCGINRRICTVIRSVLCYINTGKYSISAICESLLCMHSLLSDYGVILNGLMGFINLEKELLLKYLTDVVKLKESCIVPMQIVVERKERLFEKFLEVEKSKIMLKNKENSPGKSRIMKQKIPFEPNKGHLLPLHLRSRTPQKVCKSTNKDKPVKLETKSVQTSVSRSLPNSPVKLNLKSTDKQSQTESRQPDRFQTNYQQHSTPIKENTPRISSSLLDEYAEKWGEIVFDRILHEEIAL